MKKISAIAIAILVVCTMLVLPTAAVENYNITCDIVISACFSNPNTVPYEGPASTKDMVEYMEIVNVSNHDVDLYDYVFYYVTKKDPATILETAASGTFNKSNTFANAPGEHVLAPGQMAIIWFVGDDNYEYLDSNRLHTVNSDGTVTHLTEKFWELLRDFSRDMCLQNPPETFDGLLIPWDISTEHGIGNSEHFNLANPSATKSIGYFICARDTTVDTYLSAAIIPCTSLSADVEFCFDLSNDKVLTCTNDIFYDITPGYLHSTQVNLAAELGIELETAPAETTTVAPETTAAPETTPAPEETTAEPTVETTTAAPAPAETTTAAPATTTAPKTDADKGGCGGAIVAPALLLACVPAALLKKKKHN